MSRRERSREELQQTLQCKAEKIVAKLKHFAINKMTDNISIKSQQDQEKGKEAQEKGKEAQGKPKQAKIKTKQAPEKAEQAQEKATKPAKGPCPWLCNLVPTNVPLPAATQAILHPRKDVFVLKVTKVGPTGDRRSKMELELVTPKGPEKKPLCRIDTRETQCDPELPPCCCMKPKKKKKN